MKLIVVENEQEVSQRAFEIMHDLIVRKPDAILGLATGTTPLGLYRAMVEDHQKNGTDYSKIQSYNLDEYVGLEGTHPQSYRYFMQENLFDHINIKRENTHVANGMAADMHAECVAYEEELRTHPRDLQILGIGSNGHIAFNEPGTPFDSRTHVVELTDSTRKDNSRLFDSIDEVPYYAISMGIQSILESKEILLLATGPNKAEAIYRLMNEPASPALPVSALVDHPNVTVLCDRAAAQRLQ